jgi:hypothetical protein
MKQRPWRNLVVVLGLLALAIFSRFSFFVICPFLALAMGSLAFVVAGFAAPKRTVVGQRHAVRWEAFRQYLKDLDTDEATEARLRFSRLLPYAIALGVDKGFVEKFAKSKAPAPPWWRVPAERQLDTSHQKAHDWVSSSQIPQSQSDAPQTSGGLRRLKLKSSGEGSATGPLLKNIRPEFMEFLKYGLEIFSKSPVLEDDKPLELDSNG